MRREEPRGSDGGAVAAPRVLGYERSKEEKEEEVKKKIWAKLFKKSNEAKLLSCT